MIYTVVGDPHCKPGNLEQVKELFELVEDEGNPVIWLGDMLDTKEIIRGKCLNLLYDCLKKSKLPHIIIVGNHDFFNLECEDYSLRVLELLDNLTIVDKLTFLEEGVIAVPYMPDDQFRSIIASSKSRILICHQGVTGFDYGTGHIAEDEIDFKSLKKFKLVLAGHFHKYQKEGNLTYLGTPFSHSFGETDQKKYIGFLDTEKGILTKQETPFKRHVTEEIDCDSEEDRDVNFKESFINNNFVRIILKGKKENIEKFDKSVLPTVRFIEKANTIGRMSKNVVSEEDPNEVKFVKWAKTVKKLETETVTLGVKFLEDA